MMQKIGRVIVLFAIARLLAGVAVIALFDRDAVAWGYEVTLIVLAAAVIYVGVALAVRRWSPGRRAS